MACTFWTFCAFFLVKCSCVPPCGVRQHWRRHQRAGSEGVVSKQERGAHYKKRKNPEERQNIYTTGERGGEERGRQRRGEKPREKERQDNAFRMKT